MSRLASMPIRERILRRFFPAFSTLISTPLPVASSDSDEMRSFWESSRERELEWEGYGEDLERRSELVGFEVGRKLGFLVGCRERGRR